MMVMRMEEGRSCPLLLCETCHEPITQKRQGMAFWKREDEHQRDVPIRFAHKGDCDDRDAYPYSQELPEWLYELNFNTKIEPKRPIWWDYETA